MVNDEKGSPGTQDKKKCEKEEKEEKGKRVKEEEKGGSKDLKSQYMGQSETKKRGKRKI